MILKFHAIKVFHIIVFFMSKWAKDEEHIHSDNKWMKLSRDRSVLCNTISHFTVWSNPRVADPVGFYPNPIYEKQDPDPNLEKTPDPKLDFNCWCLARIRTRPNFENWIRIRPSLEKWIRSPGISQRQIVKKRILRKVWLNIIKHNE